MMVTAGHGASVRIEACGKIIDDRAQGPCAIDQSQDRDCLFVGQE